MTNNNTETISLRVTKKEKDKLIKTSEVLGMSSVSDLIRFKLIPNDNEVYINYINTKIESLSDGRVISYKNLIRDIWDSLSYTEILGLLIGINSLIKDGKIDLLNVSLADHNNIKGHLFKINKRQVDDTAPKFVNVEVYVSKDDGVMSVDSIYTSLDYNTYDKYEKECTFNTPNEDTLLAYVSSLMDIDKEIIDIMY